MDTRIATTADGIMSRPVVTVPPGLDVASVAALLHEHRISGIPVVDPDGHVLGLVSEYDLLAKTGTTAEEIMTTAVISVSPDTAIADVRQLLVSQRIGRLPVLAGGRVAGIISRGDLVALLATEWVCGVCGEPARGEHAPASCPKCGGGQAGFTLQEQPPGP
ncbi:CBS domain-containing protein [Arthrobacter wenxiniae]|jgi:CBS-domain-containing membrane protein|uniref:CBS domain-containing protein n=1 Tax=Arthrobacter wenxiniae TaxID=2713570 RepID=A0A7Y7IEI7_9MICC|nr:CBS domain-containing protein [Arthrobacter wenxiniae]NVM94007.1 CBS domain-containing protein [Arthrobacter wenxiniae]